MLNKSEEELLKLVKYLLFASPMLSWIELEDIIADEKYLAECLISDKKEYREAAKKTIEWKENRVSKTN